MALFDPIVKICDKLNRSNWKGLFAEHGLDVSKQTPALLEKELSRPLATISGTSTINRLLPGFEDFSLDGNRAIEPGIPARSLLYHALASPNVLLAPSGTRLAFEIDGKPFPTLADLEDVENYLFGVQKRTLAELATHSGASRFSIVTFAYEYRPAPQTPHGFHADMVFSRTGVARVGTAPAKYLPDLRGFLPDVASDPAGIRVSPSRFGVFLAVTMNGNAAEFRPMRFRDASSPGNDPPNWIPDDQRSFFVPIHKLFAGTECVQGATVSVGFEAVHVNDKILRVHQALGTTPAPPLKPPFRIQDGIASLSASAAHGKGVLIPDVHSTLAEEAKLPNGKLATFTVKGTAAKKFDSLALPSHDGINGFRNSPEYVHIRTKVVAQAKSDLNQLTDAALDSQLQTTYEALHYVDFAGDGWVVGKASATQWASNVLIDTNAIAAYSLVTAPDFFPSCDQRELTEWTANTVPDSIEDQIWFIPPDTLADQRLAPNLQLPNQPFVSKTQPSIPPAEIKSEVALFTMSALVSMPGHSPTTSRPITAVADRHSHLADDAAGVFAPGWDTSLDFIKSGTQRIWHSAAYGLGSPFPEDAKLCAALSTFWPAVAPDATREMEPPVGGQEGTVSPLTDQEIGQIGGMSWDGVAGPQVVTVGTQDFAEYPNSRRVDYVQNALLNRFTARLTGRITAREYQQRVLAASFAYLAVGFERTGSAISPTKLRSERVRWKMLSFQKADPSTIEFQAAKSQTGHLFNGEVYRVELFPRATATPVPGDLFKVRLKMSQRFFLFVDVTRREIAIREKATNNWHKGQFNV
jgi:hypothetical protein